MLTDKEIRDAGWEFACFDSDCQRYLFAKSPVKSGSTLHNRQQVESEIARERAESERKAKHDRLIAAGWIHHGGTAGYRDPGAGWFHYTLNQAIAELDRREAAAKLEADKPRNRYLELHGWKPRFNAFTGDWYWDNDKLHKGGCSELFAVRFQRSILCPKPRAGELRRHGFTYHAHRDVWLHPEIGHGMSYSHAVKELEKALRIANPSGGKA